jgi:uncharacterized protein YdeI (YjbR/CyaY-like superfamily)
VELLAFETRAAFHDWLEANHATVDGLWLKVAKKGSGIPTVTYAEALEVALCFGWIDGQRKALDDVYFQQKYTPRRARSTWSKVNVAKAEALIEGGDMRPAGLAEVERAKADGRWAAAYDSPRTMAVPEDLQTALDASPEAAAGFAALDGANRYSILYRLQAAKRPETRARRLEQFVAMLQRGERLH